MALFQKGEGGRSRGARNRLSHSFLEALEAAFNEHGPAAIRICAIEKPIEFCKMIAGLMPAQLEVETTNFNGIPDDELTVIIERIRSELAERAVSIGVGENPTAH
jgi:hypothetical protein